MMSRLSTYRILLQQRSITTSYQRKQVDTKRIIEFFKDWNDPQTFIKTLLPGLAISGFYAFWLSIGLDADHTPDNYNNNK